MRISHIYVLFMSTFHSYIKIGQLLFVSLRSAQSTNPVDLGDNGDRMSVSAHDLAGLSEMDATTERRQNNKVKLRTQMKTLVNIKLWVAFMTLTATFLATDAVLRYAVLTTLEKRFGFTSVYNGVLVSAYDMGHVVALVVLSIVGKMTNNTHLLYPHCVTRSGGFESQIHLPSDCCQIISSNCSMECLIYFIFAIIS